uniref:Endonuclease/exonuclease/phosphatase domain-containing protein n=1 Tax=viral metagenome TaxID=1070528 RepID=A0A6C0AFW9_9ZZZZ
MRHGLGNQPSKFFNLMFDTIDKILVRKNVKVINPKTIKNYGFKRYNIKNYDYLMNIRLNGKFKDFCQNTIKTNCTIQSFTEDSVFRELYPNKNAPSDHPPISCKIEI